MQIVFFTALALAPLWFVFFVALTVSQMRAAASAPAARLDPVGRKLVNSARGAFFVFLGGWAAYASFAAVNTAFGLGFNLYL